MAAPAQTRYLRPQVAASLVAKLGPKWSLASGLFLYCFYVASFLIVALVPSAQWEAAIIGAIIGGFSAGWLWTAQGVFFSRTAALYAKATGRERSDTNSLFAGVFTVFFLAFEVLLKLLSSALHKAGGNDLVCVCSSPICHLSHASTLFERHSSLLP